MTRHAVEPVKLVCAFQLLYALDPPSSCMTHMTMSQMDTQVPHIQGDTT